MSKTSQCSYRLGRQGRLVYLVVRRIAPRPELGTRSTEISTEINSSLYGGSFKYRVSNRCNLCRCGQSIDGGVLWDSSHSPNYFDYQCFPSQDLDRPKI